MKTIAYFENIQSHLKTILNNAKNEIIVAVPWFTDKQLFNILCQQSQKGLNIQLLLMDDEINRTSRLPFQKLELSGGKLFWVPEGGRLMHNKYAVIDKKIVVTGSYNWSNKARINDENITVISGNLGLASQYIETYQKIIRNLGYKISLETTYDLRSVNLRLKTICNFIDLEEMNELPSQIDKLHDFAEDDDLNEIINILSKNIFDKAKQLIIRYLENHQQLAKYVDPEIHQLEMRLQLYEIELNTISDQKVEMERKIISFDQQTTKQLGKYIEEYLRLRSEVLRKTNKKTETSDNTEEETEAKYEYEEYQKEYDKIKEDVNTQLTNEQQKQLKKLYRKASYLCHPDKVDHKNKELAQEIFVKLNDAYKKNDLQIITDIVTKLENGQFNIQHRKSIENRTLLELRIGELEREIAIIKKDFIIISKSEIYRKIISIDDFDDYFKKQLRQLKDEILFLSEELSLDSV